MPIYFDESGGISAGAMTMAGVQIEAENAQALLQRFKDVTGLHGEMKGSRISLVERALFFELLERFGGRAQICVTRGSDRAPGERLTDLQCYTALLTQLVDRWLPETGGCAALVIDDGRYDPIVLGQVRADIAAMIQPCGTAGLADSKRSAGVQVADVIANSFYNIAAGSSRAHIVERIVAPFLESHVLRVMACKVGVA